MGGKGQPGDSRSRGVDARDARGVQIGDNNVQHNNYGPVVRSAYLAEVRRIAPAELLDREPQLARLAAFCTGDGPDTYLWWKAFPGSGMTALLSWFVLHPPPGVRVVSCFVPAGRTERENRDAFIDVVLEQLVELTGGSMPGHLTRSTRRAHLLGRYADASEACACRGERLVLVVDGLDDRRNTSSLATLLPDHLVGMRVVLGTGFSWRIPDDLPPRHPLREASTSALLSRFLDEAEKAQQEATAARREAEKAQQQEATAARREAERQRAEDDRRRAQLRADQWRSAEAARTTPAAWAAAVWRALVFVAGWTSALVLLVFVAASLYDLRVAGILSAQIVVGGLGAMLGLVPAAYRLGAAYGAAPRSPAAWLASPRAMMVWVSVALAGGFFAGAGAADYLDARHARLLERSLGMGGTVPSFEEAVAFIFLVLIAFGCGAVGLHIARKSVGPWQERHRAQVDAEGHPPLTAERRPPRRPGR
ncbi:hypothetical protein GAR05_04805 [Micromonospora saelicesensis]|uniref:NACHT domain-containing protein n=1 Tax=Micromonospora saelicesensis TaxID=285676 RepID=A0ABX9CEH9_9ACTN|nr:hypothetical protein [Micromonospora saelicesensis]RAN94715.1 hypothetical protein GAR05_04805 [Micromonospora saelicesensis]